MRDEYLLDLNWAYDELTRSNAIALFANSKALISPKKATKFANKRMSISSCDSSVHLQYDCVQIIWNRNVLFSTRKDKRELS